MSLTKVMGEVMLCRTRTEACFVVGCKQVYDCQVSVGERWLWEFFLLSVWCWCCTSVLLPSFPVVDLQFTIPAPLPQLSQRFPDPVTAHETHDSLHYGFRLEVFSPVAGTSTPIQYMLQTSFVDVCANM